MDDPFNLQRFVEAQAPVYATVLDELRQGRKRTHWMWFIFPQIAGLGSSPTSQFFALSGREEAIAYLRHPLLGGRLLECVATVNGVQGRSALEIFSRPDDCKFQSSLTLFNAVADDPTLFQTALAKFYGGEADPATMERL